MRKNKKYSPRFYPATITLASLLLSIVSPVQAAETWVVEEREVLVTAYYSPLPNQRKYYLGSYDADISFNGRGIQGKDGTEVYPGMVAAPSEYPFGTRVEFPSLDAVGTVHDRGGRIVEGEDGTLRLDVWMGKGEEGLARALNFGAQTMTAKLYIPQNFDIPDERFVLTQFDAPATVLKKLPSNPISLLGKKSPRYGDTSNEVAAIQHNLSEMGYFDHPITSYYGDVTKKAVGRYKRESKIIPGTGYSGEVADEETRTTIAAHIELIEQIGEPEIEEETLLQGADGRAVRILQRILKLLDKYEGEIDGIYDQQIMSTIYSFQKELGVVNSPADSGAGIVGPSTRRALLTAWRAYRIDKRGGPEVVVAAIIE